MVINDITVPDAGTTKQYIQDPIGGWVYEVITTVTVNQHNLEQFQDNVAQLKAQLADIQAQLDEVQPVATDFATAIAAQPVSLAPTVDSASTTPQVM